VLEDPSDAADPDAPRRQYVYFGDGGLSRDDRQAYNFEEIRRAKVFHNR